MCALFGLLDYKGSLLPGQRLRIVRALANASEVRGTDAAGIAFFHHGKLCIQKAPKPAHKMKFWIPAEARYVIGHTRMTTQGSASHNQNNHPFPGRAGNQVFALAHNGVLTNDRELRRTQKLPRAKIETDSYVAVQLIERQNGVSFPSLRAMAEQVEGHFTFTVLDRENNFYFVKGENPLAMYHAKKHGLYLYASTESILLAALRSLGMEKLAHETIQLWPGDILRIDSQGQRQQEHFQMKNYFSLYPAWDDPLPGDTPQQVYIEALKTAAAFRGYRAEMIDCLLADGYTTDDIEEWIYR